MSMIFFWMSGGPLSSALLSGCNATITYLRERRTVRHIPERRRVVYVPERRTVTPCR